MPSCGLLAANVTSSAQRPLEITRFLNLVGNKPEPLPGIGNYGWSWIKGNQGQTVTLDCNVNNQISAEVIAKSCKTFNEQLKTRQNVNPSQLSQIKLFVTKLIDQFFKISNSNQNGIGTLKNIGLLSLNGVFLLNSNSNPFVLFVDYGWKSNGISQDGIDDITKWIHQGHHLAIAQGVYPPDYSEKKALARFICLILAGDLNQAQNPMAFSHCNVAGKEIWAKLLKAQDSELSVSDLDIDIGPLFSLEVKKMPLVPIVGGSFVVLCVLSLAIVWFLYRPVVPVVPVVTAQINLNGLPAGSVKIEDLDFKGCSPVENAKVEVVDGKASLKVIINKGSEQGYTVALKTGGRIKTELTVPPKSSGNSDEQLKNLQAISLVAENLFEKNFLLNRFEAIEMLKKGLLDNPKAKDAPGGSDFVSWVVTRTKQE